METATSLQSIKEITPEAVAQTGVHLRGVVSLRWPYSSSQRVLSLQLADEDIRKRANKGHVRLIFSGNAAVMLRDLPALCTLEIAAHADAIKLETSKGSIREISHVVHFTGKVTIARNDQPPETLDSSKVVTTDTPVKVKRTWLTPEMILPTTIDALDLDEAWFSDSTPPQKRARYSSNFKLIPNSSFTTPSKSPKADTQVEAKGKSPILSSSQSSMTDVHLFNTKFEFQPPVNPLRPGTPAELGKETTPIVHVSIDEKSRVQESSQSTNRVGPTIPKSPIDIGQGELRPSLATSRPGSVTGDIPSTTIDHGTPRSGPQVHFNFMNIGSAPPTPRNVPYLSLESASEQEDFYRKLRASAPPKSDAGSSMVADEDDEAGNLAVDPNPTILETQSRIQEGILRQKINDESGDESLVQHQQVLVQTGESEHEANNGIDSDQAERASETRAMTGARSTVAAYGNSLAEIESIDVAHEQEDSVLRQRETSPSMTERGAAVQESVFRSKIQGSHSGSDVAAQSVRSVKSSVLVEPAAASIDGSVRENIERTMLDQQASVQETLFREKLDRTESNPTEPVQDYSVLGQSNGASSVAGEIVYNNEPSMLQQQASVQENIFREKVHQNSSGMFARLDPASLEYIDANTYTRPMPTEISSAYHEIEDDKNTIVHASVPVESPESVENSLPDPGQTGVASAVPQKQTDAADNVTTEKEELQNYRTQNRLASSSETGIQSFQVVMSGHDFADIEPEALEHTDSQARTQEIFDDGAAAPYMHENASILRKSQAEVVLIGSDTDEGMLQTQLSNSLPISNHVVDDALATETDVIFTKYPDEENERLGQDVLRNKTRRPSESSLNVASSADVIGTQSDQHDNRDDHHPQTEVRCSESPKYDVERNSPILNSQGSDNSFVGRTGEQVLHQDERSSQIASNVQSPGDSSQQTAIAVAQVPNDSSKQPGSNKSSREDNISLDRQELPTLSPKDFVHDEAVSQSSKEGMYQDEEVSQSPPDDLLTEVN